MILPFPVVLASGSPRRRQLLADLIGEFEVYLSNVDEDALTVADPFETAVSLANAKAEVVRDRFPGALVIGADTVVALEAAEGWVQLTKPTDPADAVRILGALSGRTHVVATGVALLWPYGALQFFDRTEVTFRELTLSEIEAYVATGEPTDKAGAYGLQDQSQDFIERVEGSRTNVIGLPMEALARVLAELRA